MRWLIVEDSLESREGHWFEYLKGFHQELSALGDQVELLVSKQAKPFIQEHLGGLPVLPESVYLKMSDGSSISRRYARVPVHAWQTHRAIKKYIRQNNNFDVIFVPTVLIHHLLGWTWLIKRILKKSPLRVLLFFPNTPVQLDLKTHEPSWLSAPTAKLFHWLIRSLQNEVKQGRVILGVETHPMRAALLRLTNVPFTHLPHPVTLGSGVKGQRSEVGPPSTITVGSYGSARHEKGSDLLVAAVNEFCCRHPDSRARFVLQCVGGDAEQWKILQDNPKVRLISGFFADGEYARQLQETDVLLLPYRRSSYALRVSRVMIEAMVHGIPVVATRGTTLAEQAEQFGAAVLCEDENVESLVAAIETVERDYELLAAKSRERQALACRHFSVNQFRKILLHE
jgi:glycosyltransferase involved in cell wall biosynthesis